MERNAKIIKRMAELRSGGDKPHPVVRKKQQKPTTGTETIYLTPGQKIPPPKAGVSQVIVKQEVWAMKIESNTADDPHLIVSSEEEDVSTAPTAVSSSSQGAAHPFDQELDFYRQMNVMPDPQQAAQATQPPTYHEDPAQQQQWTDDQYYATQFDQLQEQQYGAQPLRGYDQQQQPQQMDVDAPAGVKSEPGTEGADPVVGTQGDEALTYPAEYDKMMRRKFKPKKRDVTEVFRERMKKYPWPADNEELDMTLEKAPPANLPKSKAADRPPRQCWLRLNRKWLLDNFLKHLFSKSNIRYKETTYASICHHETTPYDCHPLCWQCYYELGLPFCGLEDDIECPHCRTMGEETTRLRNEKLRLCRALRKKEDQLLDKEREEEAKAGQTK